MSGPPPKSTLPHLADIEICCLKCGYNLGSNGDRDQLQRGVAIETARNVFRKRLASRKR